MDICFTEEAYRFLLERIFEKAFEDYVFAINNGNISMQKDCERFFASDYANDLANVNWAHYGRKIKANALKFIKLTETIPEELKCPQCGSAVKIYKYKRKNSYARYSCPKCYMVRTIRINEGD